jgi:isopentenyl diphosphate isomerase/L-lactate dehydrogenase-like FMN-dependent dehydrogenase
MAVSSNSSFPIEKIKGAATGPLWFQLYTATDMAGTRERVLKALDTGCEAVAFTVDAPYSAPRERDIRNQLRRAGTQQPARRGRAGEAPPRPYGLEPRLTAFLNWSFVDELRGWVKTPLLIKGILTPEDALLAVEHGADGVIVSNHGGRYLDGDPATIEVLPDIVDAVGGKIPVLVDSGFRRGTDILKALAIGAKAVLVGRAPLWGLGAFGEPGARRVLEILQKELAWAMALAGRANIDSIDRSAIRIEP